MNDKNIQWDCKMVTHPGSVLTLIEKIGTAQYPVIDMKISAVNKSIPAEDKTPHYEFHVFYQQDSSAEPMTGSDWKQATDPDDICHFLNGEKPYSQDVVDARICGFSTGSQTEFYVYYRFGKKLQRWNWKLATNIKEVMAFLGGDGQYAIPVMHAKVVAIGDSESARYYIFYQHGSAGQPLGLWQWESGSMDLKNYVTYWLNREIDYPIPIHDGKVVTLYRSGNETRYLVFFPPGFFIIIRPMFVSSLPEYINWKHAKGFETYVVTADWIDSHVAGDDIRLKIRNCIRHYVKHAGLKYAMLIGDAEYVWTPDVYTEPPPPSLSEPWSIPAGYYHLPNGYQYTTLYYSDQTDKFEYSYGDPGWQGDYPVAIGVVPVRTSAELANVLHKTMNAPRTMQASFIYSEDVYSGGYHDAITALAGPGVTISKSVFGTSAQQSEVYAAVFERPGMLYEMGHGSVSDFVIGSIHINRAFEAVA